MLFIPSALHLPLPAPTQPLPTYYAHALTRTLSHSIMASNRVEADGAARPAQQTVVE